MQPETLSQPLLAWFHENKRILPFRTESTPYRVWVSEIMLQQTRVSAVLDYFERFMRELPTVQALAECPPDRLMKLWEGLGYYSRARNLQKAAQIIVAEYGGQLPADYKALLHCPALANIPPGQLRPSRSACPSRLWTAMCCVCSAVCFGTKATFCAPTQKSALQHKLPTFSRPTRPALITKR